MKKFNIALLALVLSANPNVRASSNDSTINRAAVAGQALSIGLQVWNVANYMYLNQTLFDLQKESWAINRDDSSDYKTKLLRQTRLTHQFDAWKNFTNTFTPLGLSEEIDDNNKKHTLGVLARLSATSVAMPGTNQTHPVVLSVNYGNALTSLPTVWNHAQIQYQAAQAKREADQLTVGNVVHFLEEKVSRSIIDKINAPKGTARESFARESRHDGLSDAGLLQRLRKVEQEEAAQIGYTLK